MFLSCRTFALSRVCNGLRSTVRSKHTLPKLPYDYAALEPIICGEIMELHHQKHHQGYVNNLNAGEEQLQEAISKNDVTKIVSLGNALKFNGGGHINHTIFWQNLTPNKTQPSQELKTAIDASFKSFDNFKKEMTTLTVAIQGSGWGWLGYNKKTGKVQLAACANQDPLEATTGLVPLFGIDVWEHAYYLQYKNLRPSYVEAIFDIANWEDVSKRLACAKLRKKSTKPEKTKGKEDEQQARKATRTTVLGSNFNNLTKNYSGLKKQRYFFNKQTKEKIKGAK